MLCNPSGVNRQAKPEWAVVVKCRGEGEVPRLARHVHPARSSFLPAPKGHLRSSALGEQKWLLRLCQIRWAKPRLIRQVGPLRHDPAGRTVHGGRCERAFKRDRLLAADGGWRLSMAILSAGFAQARFTGSRAPQIEVARPEQAAARQSIERHTGRAADPGEPGRRLNGETACCSPGWYATAEW